MISVGIDDLRGPGVLLFEGITIWLRKLIPFIGGVMLSLQRYQWCICICKLNSKFKTMFDTKSAKSKGSCCGDEHI